MSMKNSRLSKVSLLSLAILSALTGGCATDRPLRGTGTPQEAIERSAQVWPEPAVEREGEMSMVLITPMGLPNTLASKSIKLSMQPGTTIKDMVAVLAMEGVHVVIADKEAAEKTFYLPHYKGTLGDLLKVLSRTANVFFTWRDGLVVVSNTERFAVAVPQEAKLSETLKTGITSLGGTAMVHPDAGLLVFECSPKVLEHIKLYVDRLTRNSALVTLEVAILSVTLSDESKRGVDWDKLIVGLGKGVALTNTTNPGTTGTTGGTGTGTTGTTTGTTTTSTTGTAGVTATAVIPEDVIKLSSGALQIGLFSQRVSLSVLTTLLDKYGTTDTLQNVKTKTLTGHESELSNNTQIPYIKSVGVSTTGSTVATGNNTAANNSLLGSTNSATADDGVTLKLLPTYDRDANTVTIEMNLSVDSVLGFNDLSAGNQIGTLTQPTTAKRKLNDILRLRPGQTAIVGGVIYENISDARTTLLRSKELESSALTKKRNEMFIVVRPTVSQFGKVLSQEEGATRVGQDYLPDAVLPAEPVVEKGLSDKAARKRSTRKGVTQSQLPAPTIPGSQFKTPDGSDINLPAIPGLGTLPPIRGIQ